MRFMNKIRIANSVLGPPSTPFSSPESNPWHGTETPEERALSSTKPAKVNSVKMHNPGMQATGISGALFHYDADGNKTGVAKQEKHGESIHEPMYYQLAKHFIPELAVPTVNRMHEPYILGAGLKTEPYSIQQYIEPHPDYKRIGGMIDGKIHGDNPDMLHIGLMDHIAGQADRNEGNYIVDTNNRIRPIDNTFSMSNVENDHNARYVPSAWAQTNPNMPITEETRKQFLSVSPETVGKEFDRIIGHPATKAGSILASKNYQMQKEKALERLKQVHEALSDRGITTQDQLRQRLYPKYISKVTPPW